jgi:hypothetical protein
MKSSTSGEIQNLGAMNRHAGVTALKHTEPKFSSQREGVYKVKKPKF